MSCEVFINYKAKLKILSTCEEYMTQTENKQDSQWSKKRKRVLEKKLNKYTKLLMTWRIKLDSLRKNLRILTYIFRNFPRILDVGVINTEWELLSCHNEDEK